MPTTSEPQPDLVRLEVEGGYVVYVPARYILPGPNGGTISAAAWPQGEPVPVYTVFSPQGQPLAQVQPAAGSPQPPVTTAQDVPAAVQPGGSTPAAPAPAAGGGNNMAPSTSAPASGGASTSTPDPDVLFGVPDPDGYAIIDGSIWLVYTNPTTGNKLRFKVERGEEWEAYMRGGAGPPLMFQGTEAQALAAGYLASASTAAEIASAYADGLIDEDPWSTFESDIAEQLALSPMMNDEQILDLFAAAALEGRAPTEAELAGTDYYQSHSAEQQAWDLYVLRDPTGAARDQESNRDFVRTLLSQAGYLNAPDSLVSYLADQWTTGVWTEQQLRTQIVQETDPYAPGASPFAGIYDFTGAGGHLVTDGTNTYVRTADGDYLLDGGGQQARFGDQAQMIRDEAVLEGAQFLQQGDRFFLRLADGTVLEATGPGQVAALRARFGAPAPVPDTYRDGSGNELTPSGTVVDFFGGPGGIEAVGAINQVGTAADLAAVISAQGGQTTVQLGEEERVTQLLHEWLGPMHAAGYSDAWIAREAGAIRNGGPGAEDALIDRLRALRQSIFPNYTDPNVTYEDIAQAWSGEWINGSGSAPDPFDPDFHRILQANDANFAQQTIRSRGLRDGWVGVTSEAIQGLSQGLGSQVRHAIQTR